MEVYNGKTCADEYIGKKDELLMKFLAITQLAIIHVNLIEQHLFLFHTSNNSNSDTSDYKHLANNVHFFIHNLLCLMGIFKNLYNKYKYFMIALRIITRLFIYL
jgi:hypothetical protein